MAGAFEEIERRGEAMANSFSMFLAGDGRHLCHRAADNEAEHERWAPHSQASS